MGLKLVRRARWRDPAVGARPEPLPLRAASVSGRQLFTLASAWPELQPQRVIGVYHALGAEKVAVATRTNEVLRTAGIDSIKPAATIFEHSHYGPFVALAIALDCQGPFFSLEANELAGAVAFATAATDLAEGRCGQALVGAYLPPDDAWLALVEADAGGPRCGAVFARADEAEALAPALRAKLAWDGPLDVRAPDPRDPHGLWTFAGALEDAARRPTAVFSRCPDGRAALVGFTP